MSEEETTGETQVDASEAENVTVNTGESAGDPAAQTEPDIKQSDQTDS